MSCVWVVRDVPMFRTVPWFIEFRVNEGCVMIRGRVMWGKELCTGLIGEL